MTRQEMVAQMGEIMAEAIRQVRGTNQTLMSEEEMAGRAISGEQTGASQHSLKLGDKYMVETVTKYFTGRLERITDEDVVLSDAAWIADTGRYYEAVTGTLPNAAEVEPYPDGLKLVVSRKAVVAFVPWNGDLPRDTNEAK